MNPDWPSLLAQLGVAGVGLYLFVKGVLLSKPTADQLLASAEARRLAEAVLYQARIAEGDARWAEMRDDRNEWRRLALQTERRLDQAVPTIASAIGAPVPSDLPTQPRADG